MLLHIILSAAVFLLLLLVCLNQLNGISKISAGQMSLVCVFVLGLTTRARFT